MWRLISGQIEPRKQRALRQQQQSRRNRQQREPRGHAVPCCGAGAADSVHSDVKRKPRKRDSGVPLKEAPRQNSVPSVTPIRPRAPPPTVLHAFRSFLTASRVCCDAPWECLPCPHRGLPTFPMGFALVLINSLAKRLKDLNITKRDATKDGPWIRSFIHSVPFFLRSHSAAVYRSGSRAEMACRLFMENPARYQGYRGLSGLFFCFVPVFSVFARCCRKQTAEARLRAC